MHIKNITSTEKIDLKNDLYILKEYLKSISSLYKKTANIENSLSNLTNNQKFNTKSELNNFLKTLSQPNDSNLKELYKFFSNYQKKKNHYIQSALLKNIIDKNDKLIYFNYSTFYKNFKNIANNPKSNEYKIFIKLKKDYSSGIQDYFNYFIKNISKSLNPLSLVNQPQTYFITNYTENMLKTSLIENNFIKGVNNNSLNEIDIIKYFSLHFSRSCNLFLSAIKTPYIKLNKINPISFNDYCIIQFIYHLTMITVYCTELEYLINNISNLKFSVKNTNDIIFSDTISNTIKNIGYTGIFIDDSRILLIDNHSTTFNNQKYLYDSFFNSQEFVCMSTSQISIFNKKIFESYFKYSFYNSIFPFNDEYIPIHSTQINFELYLNNGYFLDSFKTLSQKYEQ